MSGNPGPTDDELWSSLFANLEDPERQPNQLVPVSHYLAFYTKVYNYYNAPTRNQQPPCFTKHELYQQPRFYVTKHAILVLNQGNNFTGEDLLKFHTEKWKEFEHYAERLKILFSFFDSRYTERDFRVSQELYNMALRMWRASMLEEMIKRLTNAMLDQIASERTGKEINKEYISVTIKCLFDLENDGPSRHKLRAYKKHFEKKLLSATREFYTKKSREFSNSNVKCYIDYMLNVEKILLKEEENAQLYHSSTKSELTKVISNSLISNHLSYLQSRFASLLLLNENRYELTLIYKTCSKVAFGLVRLELEFHKYITKKGLETMEAMAAEPRIDTKLYVETVLEFRKNFRKFVSDVFYMGSVFMRSIDTTCRLFMNANAITQRDPRPPQIQVTGTAAELLARYCDQLLDKRSEESRHADLYDLSNKIKSGLQYIRDKDIFSKFSTLMLSNRLIHDSSVSYGAEIAFFAKLADKDAQQSTTKLCEMMIDAKVSKQLTRDFNSKQPIELDVFVMSSDSWPSLSTTELDIPLHRSDQKESFRQSYTASWATFPKIQLNLPMQLSNTMDSFHQFYKEKYNNQRRLTWVLSQCHAEVASDAFQTEHLFVVTAAQMCTLLLFNDQDSYTVNQICDATGMDAMTTSQVVGSLIEQHVLKAESDSAGKGIPMSAIISLNENFTSEEVRVDLAKLIVENEQERQFEKLQANLTEDRMSLIEMYILDVLEKSNRIDESGLIRKVQIAMAEQYKPSIDNIIICIKSLAEKMIIATVGVPPNIFYEHVC